MSPEPVQLMGYIQRKIITTHSKKKEKLCYLHFMALKISLGSTATQIHPPHNWFGNCSSKVPTRKQIIVR